MVNAIRTVYQGGSIIQPTVVDRLIGHLGRCGKLGAPTNGLSPREIEVLRLMATGAANKAIADQLIISQSTVKTHIVRIFSKMCVAGRTEAVAEGIKKGIIEL